ncbi:MAG: hypothetical protein NWF00_05865 [Candidatus Bathyarchaeota archaeon]|nr:hypothetical protein [Candidatus Bathyarchaeota archaeon]
MNEEEMKVLKFMNEITGRTDMNDFAKKAGLTANVIIQDMQQLAKEGFTKKVGAGYTITEKGKGVLKASVPVSENMVFHFYTAVDEPLGISACTIREFCELAAKVDAASLEFHVGRGDFESWLRAAANDADFADAFVKIKDANLTGAELREAIVKTAESKYYL